MDIRNLSENDISQLLKIEEAVYETPWSAETFMRCFEVNYKSLGATLEDQLCGYVFYSITVGECHILNIAVNPRFQHQGIGEKLLTKALQQAKELKAQIAYLEVRRSNVHAIKLYNKMDFIQIGERKDYYPTNTGREDALLFAKDLSE